MNTPKKNIDDVTEEYDRIHNIPINVTESITHIEFVKGLQDGTVGFAPTAGELIQLVSGIGRIFFTICLLLYLFVPILIVPLWAYHERNWWLLLGIIVACLITPQL